MRKRVGQSEVTTTISKEELAALHPLLKTRNNRHILRSLFIESPSESVKNNMADTDTENEGFKPLFTLKDYNYEKGGVVYYSLKPVYFSYDHVPGFEYEFAKDVFNSWEHWSLLCSCNGLIADTIAKWRDEYTIMLQAKALRAITKVALYEGSKGTPAARFLADRGWEVKRGRPTTEEVTRERKIAAGVEKEVAEDIERMGLTLVKSK